MPSINVMSGWRSNDLPQPRNGPAITAALVVDGSASIAGENLGAWDFLYVNKDERHNPIVFPEGATLLASGDQIPNQAFRVGELAWGTQFHCEVNRSELEFWLDEFAKDRRLTSLSTAKQGMAIEVCYEVTLARDRSASELVRTLNRIEGVQGVTLHMTTAREE